MELGQVRCPVSLRSSIYTGSLKTPEGRVSIRVFRSTEYLLEPVTSQPWRALTAGRESGAPATPPYFKNKKVNHRYGLRKQAEHLRLFGNIRG